MNKNDVCKVLDLKNKEEELFIIYENADKKKKEFLKSIEEKYGINYKVTSLTLQELDSLILLEDEVNKSWNDYLEVSNEIPAACFQLLSNMQIR